MRKILPGRSYPLGATFDGKGVNFALFSRSAEKVELCLFDARGNEERVAIPYYTDEVWNAYIPNIRPGQKYGWRVYGAYDPSRGLRFNNNKLLIDPYAKAFSGRLEWRDEIFAYEVGHPLADISFDTRDSAPFVPKCVVVDSAVPNRPAPPCTRRTNSIIYELHIKGATKLAEKIPPALRGTFAGLAHKNMVSYLQKLGVTAVEIMPAQAFFLGAEPIGAGHNYWGYNTLGFFAPEPAYGNPSDFKNFVDAYHKAGLEVIMDAVYNHTIEGNHLGPTLSFKGIDNQAYYKLAADKRYYFDTTGVGNTLNFDDSRVVEMTMDSLRYWSREMGVDGFRFDLAVSLGRVEGEFEKTSAFFNVMQQDPTMQRAKKIAEPWDVGGGGYQLGNFPPGWSEWNGKFRDTVREFWLSYKGAGEMATAFSGSAELFNHSGRRPWAGVNYITSHDGLALRDLAGDLQTRKNMLATLILSQGIPMLLSGDEFGRSQRGNDNAYAEDSAVSWTDWAAADIELYEFVRGLLELRKRHPAFRRSRFYRGTTDIKWLAPSGEEMGEKDWTAAKSLVFYISGEADMFHLDKDGTPMRDTDFFVVMNPFPADLRVRAPAGKWRIAADTSGEVSIGIAEITVGGNCFLLLEKQ